MKKWLLMTALLVLSVGVVAASLTAVGRLDRTVKERKDANGFRIVGQIMYDLAGNPVNPPGSGNSTFDGVTVTAWEAVQHVGVSLNAHSLLSTDPLPVRLSDGTNFLPTGAGVIGTGTLRIVGASDWTGKNVMIDNFGNSITSYNPGGSGSTGTEAGAMQPTDRIIGVAATMYGQIASGAPPDSVPLSVAKMGAGETQSSGNNLMVILRDNVSGLLISVDNLDIPTDASFDEGGLNVRSFPFGRVETATLSLNNGVARHLLLDTAGFLKVVQETELPAGTNTIGNVGKTSDTTRILEDSNNTTASNLGIGATFTGTATDLLSGNGLSHAVISVFADQDSATDGLVVQFSHDGVLWPDGDHKHEFTVLANVSRSFQLGPEARFFRVTYTNGGTAQTVFHVVTMLKSNISHQTLHRIADPVEDDRDVRLTKSILVAKKPDTTFVNIGATAGGNLKMSIEEFDASLPAGSNNIGEVNAVGNIAHDAIDNGNPVKVGGIANDTIAAEVADGDRVDGAFDQNGRFIMTFAPDADFVSGNATLTTTSDVSVIAAQGAGIATFVTDIFISSGNDVVVRVDIKDGTTIVLSQWVATNGGGAVVELKTPLKGTANTAWQAALSANVTLNDIRVTMTGYKDR